MARCLPDLQDGQAADRCLLHAVWQWIVWALWRIVLEVLGSHHAGELLDVGVEWLHDVLERLVLGAAHRVDALQEAVHTDRLQQLLVLHVI